MRVYVLLILLLSSANYVFGQHGNIWYFGRNAGLDFNTSPPVALSNGALNTYEGCASFSDDYGRILFYTDGVTVFNRSHEIMQNGTGLKGDPSATQSGIIVPWPGNDSLYYIFTADAYQNNFVNGNTYSVVNIKANGGSGSVITKNIKMYPEKCTEKIAISKHENGVDWWVVTKELGNNRFRVFRIDNDGIDLKPVITDIGTAHTGVSGVGAGCMRVSADGKKLALAMGSFAANTAGVISETNLFDFDNSTGVISNFINIPGLRPYGIEFSPDSKLMYVSYEPYSTSPLTGKIDQFNVSLPATGVLASRTRITPDNFPGKPCGMQIAPDGKIYVVRENSMVMDVINLPNTPGTSCGYQVGYVKLTRQNGMMPPNIIPSFLIPVQLSIKADILYFCDRRIKFSAVSNSGSILDYKWEFGDGDSSTFEGPEKVFPFTKDTFNIFLSVRVKVPRTDGSDSIIEKKTAMGTVIFDAVPIAIFTAESACGIKTVILKDSSTTGNGSTASQYWSFGDGVTSTGAITSHTYSGFGTYNIKHVIKSAGGCPSDTAEVKVVLKDKPKAAFKDIGLCKNVAGLFEDSSSIQAPDKITGYYWDFGDGAISSLATPAKSFLPGLYNVKLVAESDKRCFSDTFVKAVLVEDFPDAEFSAAGGCEGNGLQFTDDTKLTFGTIKAWNWDFGNGSASTQQSPVFTYDTAGDFVVKMVSITTNGCTSSTAAKPVRIESIPVASFSNSLACIGQKIDFTNKSTIVFGDIASYYWDFGDGSTSNKKDPHLTYSREGVFQVKLAATTLNGCVSPPFFKSFPISQMRVSAGNDTTAVLGQPFHLLGSGGNSYRWSPAWLLDNDSAQSPVTILAASQLFTLMAANTEGCKQGAQVMIRVYKGPQVYVPTAFTPNSDGKNDMLKPVAAGVTVEIFRIFNRWGQLVFSTNGSQRGWNGTFNNIAQPAGTYIWMVKGTTEKGEIVTDKGSVVLIR